MLEDLTVEDLNEQRRFTAQMPNEKIVVDYAAPRTRLFARLDPTYDDDNSDDFFHFVKKLCLRRKAIIHAG
jgi:hypothetical protein